jgi:hypothetical protein
LGETRFHGKVGLGKVQGRLQVERLAHQFSSCMLITHYNQYFFGACLQSIRSNKPPGETKLADKTLQALYFLANLQFLPSQKEAISTETLAPKCNLLLDSLIFYE